MVGSDVTSYIQPLYNQNNNYNKFSGEESNALPFYALLPSSESLFKLLFY